MERNQIALDMPEEVDVLRTAMFAGGDIECEFIALDFPISDLQCLARRIADCAGQLLTRHVQVHSGCAALVAFL